jgi:hypothetical protein
MWKAIEADAAAMRTGAGQTAAPQHGRQVRVQGGQLDCGENHPAKRCLA